MVFECFTARGNTTGVALHYHRVEEVLQNGERETKVYLPPVLRGRYHRKIIMLNAIRIALVVLEIAIALKGGKPIRPYR